MAEYIWIDGEGGIRSKSRTLTTKIQSIKDLPEWNYDGSSTYQAQTANSEIIIKPVAFFRDPFREGDNLLVLCDTYAWTSGEFKELKPCNTNFRVHAKKILDSVKKEDIQFCAEQEFLVLDD